MSTTFFTAEKISPCKKSQIFSHIKRNNSLVSSAIRPFSSRTGRTIAAVGHTLLKVVYHMLKQSVLYGELGSDYLIVLILKT